ncbi:MAG: cytochrome c maturation protein CcmE [Nitrospina sp.]|jgi:cytochrome c-type biogenesis protein CcmE|nr:cytochrome c maturation protein CcmE [Nitrospina sp.]MBT5986042.1 cytochrome c maturation protein CcmE [Nitrospina sp.]
MARKKIKFALGSSLIVGAIGYLIATGINSTSTYFFTVSELMDQKVSFHGTGLKVKGNVVAGSIERDPGDYLNVQFAIEEKNRNLNVVYQGVTPDMFQDGGEVVVEGALDEQGVFHANTLLTSCPSKYEAEKEAGGMHPGTLPDYKPKLETDPRKVDFLPKTAI